MIIATNLVLCALVISKINYVIGYEDEEDGFHKWFSKDREVNKCKTSDGRQGLCMPYAYCFHQFDNLDQLHSNLCPESDHKICCPLFNREPEHKSIPFKRPKRREKPSDPMSPSQHLLDESIDSAIVVLDRESSREKKFIRAGHYQRPNTVERSHQGHFGPSDSQRREMTKDGKLLLETARQVARKLKLSPSKCRDHLSKYCLKHSSLWDKCPQKPDCDHSSKYRSVDGSCNNKKNPLWGKAMTQMTRLLPQFYSDGIDSFRRSLTGGELPNARLISSQMQDEDADDPNLSVLFLQYGQFIDHDITLGLNTRAESGEGLSCCDRNSKGQLFRHSACAPILIPPNDPFYSKFNLTCMNFVRNIAAPPSYHCHLGPREQANAVTHFIDGSHIYGSDEKRMAEVRAFRGGKLKVSRINGKDFLPIDNKNLSQPCSAPRPKQCVYAGDGRVNQQLGLTVLHLMFLREHNRIADELKTLNPGWTDETLFQETRRIIGAQLQWITYNEFLPLLLGRRTMKEFELSPSTWGFAYDYDKHENPGVINEFSAAAYRLHTLVMSMYRLMNSDGDYTQLYKLRFIFNNPTALYKPGAVDEVLYGIVVQPSQAFDPIFSEEIHEQLFKPPGAHFGGDLIAINIQRGRDHGLPPYNYFRDLCGLPKLKSFKDVDKYFREGTADLFRSLYRHVDDIDLFVAGVHERPIKDGVLGSVFSCIVAEQFRRTKQGDRFWFENPGEKHSFTEAQLHEIRKSSLSGIICLNADEIRYYPPLALIQPMSGNKLIECSKIGKMDLSFWKSDLGYEN